MLKCLLRPARLLATGLAFLALAGGWVSTARADIAYGFAEQTISGLSITPTITPTSGVVTITQDSTTANGSGFSNSDPLDAAQAYQGGLPMAPPNFFARYAPGSPPVSPTTPPNFTRADVAIPVLMGPGNTSSVVSESYLNSAAGPPSRETGSSALLASLSFTIPTSSALMIAYNFASDLFVITTGVGAASADYKFGITIKDAAGNIVFNSSTPNTNLGLVAPPQGGEVIRSGSETVTTPTLLAGTNYTLIFSSTADTSVQAVPEPSVTVMLGVAGLLGLGYRKFRSRSASRA